VTLAVVVILASSFAMIIAGGFAAAHVSVHLMLALGLLMIAIYAWIRLAHFGALSAAVAARDWPTAAGRLDRLRRLVATNLVLGIATIAVAIVVGSIGAGDRRRPSPMRRRPGPRSVYGDRCPPRERCGWAGRSLRPAGSPI
jgi:hypothetical protein